MKKFWTLPLSRLDPREWESLCDRCAKCCYVRDEVAGTYPCRMLDVENKLCSDYAHRFTALENESYFCMKVTRSFIASGVLPDSCAYVRRSKGMPLEKWQVEKAKENWLEQ